MAGLSNTGFSVKRLEDVKSSLEAKARELFQDLVPVGDAVDTSENTALGRMIGLASIYSTDLWEAALDTYSAFNASTATGNALDNIVSLLGITRKEAIGNTAKLLLEGNNGLSLNESKSVLSTVSGGLYELRLGTNESVILFSEYGCSGMGIRIPSPANSTVYTVSYSFDGVTYVDVSVTSPGSGTTEASIFAQLLAAINTSPHSTYFTAYEQSPYLFVKNTDLAKPTWFGSSVNITINKIQRYVDAECTTVGALTDPAGAISSIATPTTGWDSATNPSAATPGYLRESDEELRARFYVSKSSSASGGYDALATALQAVDGVTHVAIYENKTGSTDVNGITAYTNMAVVKGGLDSDVAKAIWDNIAVNTKLQGNTTVSVYSVLGTQETVYIERPTSTRFYIDLDITYTGDALTTIIPAIKEALVAYFDNYGVGEDVLYSRLFTPINSVGGFYINHLYVDDDATLTSADVVNVAVAFNKYASLSVDDITITVT